MNDYDVIIVGQGIAGTTLAWRLLERGLRVLVVDRGDESTASRVAAGLITPVTGKRLAVTEGWRDDWPVASDFYRAIEERLETPFLTTEPAIRLFASDEELQLFRERRESDSFRSLTSHPFEPLDAGHFVEGASGFAMIEGGRLDVAKYLDASRRRFEELGAYVRDTVSAADVKTDRGVAVVDRLSARARCVVFCRGVADREDFGGTLPFEPAKGEVLTVRIEDMTEQRVVHRGVWLARGCDPEGPPIYRVGATFNREADSPLPTAGGRLELEAKLRRLVTAPYEVIDHRAAWRPILRGRVPFARRLPGRPQVGVLNGLGSKGALTAPRLADRFAAILAG